MFAQLFRGSLALVAIGASLLFINAPDEAPSQILGVIEDAATGDLRESNHLLIADPSGRSTSQCPGNNASACRSI